MADQMIFKRTEIKYMLTRQQQALILAAMEEHMVPDEYGRSTICSLYLDTPNHLLIRRSLEHPIYKEKLRVRSYGLAQPDSKVFVELKKKYEDIVYKRRIGMTETQARQYIRTGITDRDSQITREISYCLHHYEGIAPSVLLTYEREAFYDPNNHDFRMTFDDNILWRTDHLNLTDGIFGRPLLAPDQVLMEVKAAEAIPLWLVRILSANHIYKTNFSKYGMAYMTMLRESRQIHIQQASQRRIA